MLRQVTTDWLSSMESMEEIPSQSPSQSPSQTPAQATDPQAPTFSQVVFIDIPHSYPPATPVTCCYSLAVPFQTSSSDWLGVFKVGWSSTKDSYTFVWVNPQDEGDSATRQAVFDSYYLPKDEIEFYQFCYVDSSGQVRGASTPFCFRKPASQSLESNPDDDLLVVTTQEEVEQSAREKAELQRELDQLRKQNQTLTKALETEQQEAANLRGKNEQNEKEKYKLVEALGQIKEQNEDLKSNLQEHLKDADQLQELMTQMTKQEDTQEQSAAEQEVHSSGLNKISKKYNQALMKINQLKGERAELSKKVDAQCQEMAALSAKMREQERELIRLEDSVQLLQFDLQRSEKEKERICTELEEARRHTDDLKRAQQENGCDDDLKVQCQTLASQLEDAQAELAAAREQAKKGERFRERLENLILSYEQEQHQSAKKEQKLKEARQEIVDKEKTIEEKERRIAVLKSEKEELARGNQVLLTDLEELHRAYAQLRAAPPADSQCANMQANLIAGDAPAGEMAAGDMGAGDMAAGDMGAERQWEIPDLQDFSEPTGGSEILDEEPLMCRHCHECFPLITQSELEQHEQSHRICPFCMMICDSMQQSTYEDHVYSHEL